MIQRLIPFFAFVLILGISISFSGCQPERTTDKTAAEILGNPDYRGISYGGYREKSRQIQPSIEEIRSDLEILNALGIKVLRTYNLQFDFAANVLKVIRTLKAENSEFEMYVMLGAWIDCEGAWTAQPNHEKEDFENNSSEIEKAVRLANDYSDIVKIISVGNEATVHWATPYFVHPRVILKWVTHLQTLKKEGQLPPQLWITSSDNFASWGGGDTAYHVPELNALIQAVDYVSMHTYPFHDTHYDPSFWEMAVEKGQRQGDTKKARVEAAMESATGHAISQYQSVQAYLDGLGINKPIHIGETGWATQDDRLFNAQGSGAADEYKQALYYNKINLWADKNKVSCFYFEAFDEHWKVVTNPNDPENHFGLFTREGKAKYALWEKVDAGVLKGYSRDQNPVEKTFNGDEAALWTTVNQPKSKKQ